VNLKQQVQKSSFTEIPKTIYSHTIKIGVNMKSRNSFVNGKNFILLLHRVGKLAFDASKFLNKK